MLLANSSVRKAAKTARVCQYATRGSIQGIVGIALLQSNGRKGRSPFNGWRPVPPSLFIQNHCAKSDTLGFSERTPEVLTNLSWEVRFFVGNGEGIEVLAKPIFVRGVSPFYGWHAPCPLQWKQCRPLSMETGRFMPVCGGNGVILKA